MVEIGIFGLAGGRAAADRRQGPDPERMVAIIVGIGVHIAAGLQHESRLLSRGDDVALGDVAVGRGHGDVGAGDGPVLLDVQVAREENCYPMIPPGNAARDMVEAPRKAVG